MSLGVERTTRRCGNPKEETDKNPEPQCTVAGEPALTRADRGFLHPAIKRQVLKPTKTELTYSTFTQIYSLQQKWTRHDRCTFPPNCLLAN